MVSDRPAILFYDGGCSLCHGSVRFLAARDRHGHLRYAPLGGETFSRELAGATRNLPDSFILLAPDGRRLVRSDAALACFELLGGGFRALARVGRLVPRFLRDALYGAVARARHRFFKSPEEACPVTPPHLRDRFLR